MYIKLAQEGGAFRGHDSTAYLLDRGAPDNISMSQWPDRRLLDLLNIDIPIIQAPMAGSDSVALARSVSSTGALGSLACALLTADRVREAMHALRDEMAQPFNLNFSATR